EWEITPEDPVYDLLYPAAENIVTGPQKVGRLTIRDYGQGIAPNAVDLGWLRISASLKRAVSDQPKVKTKRYHRTPVGDKGLGRLATMKIGTVLRLKTAIEGENAWRTVAFSWGEFTPERTLDQIRVLKGTDSSPPVEESGTIIEIIKLNDPNQWRDLDFIEKELIPNL
ncbi:ATP-binding protein, partial [Ligilactobacillus salivarius]|nr:ATP-binding protein [Ligilactobacillus salivarius]